MFLHRVSPRLSAFFGIDLEVRTAQKKGKEERGTQGVAAGVAVVDVVHVGTNGVAVAVDIGGHAAAGGGGGGRL